MFYRTLTEGEVRRAIRFSKTKGLKVFLKPHLDYLLGPMSWRGFI
jgi:hypothetical protein